MRKIEFTKQEVAAMCKDYRDGWSLRSIADELEVSLGAVRRQLVLEGVEIRRRGNPGGGE